MSIASIFNYYHRETKFPIKSFDPAYSKAGGCG